MILAVEDRLSEAVVRKILTKLGKANEIGVVLPLKELLLRLAKSSGSARVREDLLPTPGSTSRVGPAYNLLLTSFVATHWDPMSASDISESLRRAVRRIEEVLSM